MNIQINSNEIDETSFPKEVSDYVKSFVSRLNVALEEVNVDEFGKSLNFLAQHLENNQFRETRDFILDKALSKFTADELVEAMYKYKL